MTQRSSPPREPQLRLERIRSVCRRVGFGRSTVYAKIRQGEFPAPIRLGLRAVAWVSEEIDRWIEQRIAESRCTADGAITAKVAA